MSQQFGDQVIELFAIFWCFSCAWAFVALLSWSLWMTFTKGVQHLRRLHGVPCDRCVYFTGDYRLKCTVHPFTALSEDAIDCPDFDSTVHSTPRPQRTAHQSCGSMMAIPRSTEMT